MQLPRLQGSRNWVGILVGAGAWALLGWSATALIALALRLVLHGDPAWLNIVVWAGIVAGAGWGAFRGLRDGESEAGRLLYASSGLVLGRVLGRLLAIAYSLAVPGAETWSLVGTPVEPIAGWAIALVGGFWLSIGPALLRGGAGALLGLYITGAISFLWPSVGTLPGELSMALVAALIALCVIPMLLTRLVWGMVRAAAAALPGFMLVLGFHLDQGAAGLTPYRLILGTLLLALPLAGLARLPTPAGPAAFPRLASAIRPRDALQLIGAGIVRSAMVILIVGLTGAVAAWLGPVVVHGAEALPGLPVMHNLLTENGIHVQAPVEGGSATFVLNSPRAGQTQVAVDALWQAGLSIYAAAFALGRLRRAGPFYIGHQVLRFLALVLFCGLVAFFAEQGIEMAIRDWVFFREASSGLLRLGAWLPAGALLLAVIFACLYVRDRIPFYLTGLAFSLWFAQVLLLASLLALIGGTLGRGLYAVVGSLFHEDLAGFLGVPWRQGFPLIGTALGFLVGLGYMVVLWGRKSLGRVVDGYRRLIGRIFGRVESWLDQVLGPGQRWWVLAGLVVAAGAAFWLLTRSLGAVLLPAF